MIDAFERCSSVSFVQGDGDVGGGNVAFVSVAPSDAGPAVAFVLLHHGQLLPLLHGDGPFTGAWEKRQDDRNGCGRDLQTETKG